MGWRCTWLRNALRYTSVPMSEHGGDSSVGGERTGSLPAIPSHTHTGCAARMAFRVGEAPRGGASSTRSQRLPRPLPLLVNSTRRHRFFLSYPLSPISCMLSLRRQARLRREYLYRKSLEGEAAEAYERKRRTREAIAEGRDDLLPLAPNDWRRQGGAPDHTQCAAVEPRPPGRIRAGATVSTERRHRSGAAARDTWRARRAHRVPSAVWPDGILLAVQCGHAARHCPSLAPEQLVVVVGRGDVAQGERSVPAPDIRGRFSESPRPAREEHFALPVPGAQTGLETPHDVCGQRLRCHALLPSPRGAPTKSSRRGRGGICGSSGQERAARRPCGCGRSGVGGGGAAIRHGSVPDPAGHGGPGRGR
eukprot:ctg_13.g4